MFIEHMDKDVIMIYFNLGINIFKMRAQKYSLKVWGIFLGIGNYIPVDFRRYYNTH